MHRAATRDSHTEFSKLPELNYNHLYYFWVIAKEGGIAKASRRLRRAQSTLSAQLAVLEESIGGPLFERQHRMLQLTERGRITFNYADKIFTSSQDLLAELSGIYEEPPQEIRMGILSSIPKFTIQEFLLPIMKQRHIFLSIEEGTLPAFLQRLRNETMDVVISDMPVQSNPSRQYYSRHIQYMELSIVGAKHFAALKKKFPESLNGQPLIFLTPHSQVRLDMDLYFETYGITPRILGEVQDIGLQRQFALSGVGMIAIPKRAVRNDIKNGDLVEIGKLPDVRTALWAITTKRRMKNPWTKEIVAIIEGKSGALARLAKSKSR